MAGFYSRLSYSFGNEDWKTEEKALKIQPKDRVVCITASGDRPFHLLLNECSEVVAIDANPTQNALLSLKIAALKTLGFEQYLAFLGAEKCPHRRETLRKLENLLDPESRDLWKKNERDIEKGILYQGAIEKWTRRASHAIRLFRGEKVDQLFSFDCLNAQKCFVNEHWHSPSWKKIFHLSLHPLLTRLFFKDPGLYQHIDPEIHVGSYIYRRMENCLHHYLAKENLLISLVFRGCVGKEAFPPYLTKEGAEVIRGRLKRLSFYTEDIVKYLEAAPENSFDCFSLSDVASYLDQDAFLRLIHAMHRTAKPGARFCLRQFLSCYNLPESLKPYFKRDSALEEQLEKEDRCFVYRFMVGKIVKGPV